MSSRTPIKSQPSDPISTPMKPSQSSTPKAAQISIPTPSKPTQRRSRRRLAMSVKEIKEVAEGLRKNKKESHDIGRSDEDLLPVVAPKPSRGEARAKLPEKYEILLNFFNSMESSIRLIRMKGSSPTFANISASIQNLTDKRFTYEHLAQLKYILPEAIDIEKVRVLDEVTCCIKPDLRITLQVDAIEHKEEHGKSDLRRIFRERLVNFLKEHPKGEDIPRDQLPHPFGPSEPTTNLNDHSPTNKPSFGSPAQEQFAVPSHMSSSFRKSFSKKLPLPDSQRTPLACSSNTLSKDAPLANTASSPVKCTVKPPLSKKLCLAKLEKEADKPSHAVDKCEKDLVAIDGTPAKLVSTPARLQAATPEIQTPKRSRSTMDFGSPSMGFNSPPPKKSSKRSARTQLFNTPTKIARKEDQESKAESSSEDDDVISFLPKSLLQSVKEKEKKAIEDRNAGVAEATRRQKLLSGLPHIYDMILLIVQSWKRSVMTKQELIYKLIANNSKIVDRGEVEEQLKLLQELVPDWISEKVASSGDILCCVNHKVSSQEEIRQIITEAV